ncbi:MAG: HAMP domain-containing histidine kinase [Leptolyngbyaceae cyanobacterium SL_7_1]|nr:HAMP domain-containing histidine kinase [Leptolyngbyaceae cyanobacterium SL_7_1]
MKAIAKFWKQLSGRGVDPASLQFRLTLGIATASLLGLGGLAFWTSWKMQRLVYETYSADLETVATELSQMMVDKHPQDSNDLQRVLDTCATREVWLWVNNSNGQMIARSQNAPDRPFQEDLTAFSHSPAPQIQRVDAHQILWRSMRLPMDGEISQFYIAKDITSDHAMMASLTRSLGIGTVLAVVTLIGTGAVLIWRSLSPLRQTNQLATVPVGSQARFDPTQVPSEMKQLVQTWNRLQDQLSKTGEQQRQFTSGVSHELRTPLSVVYGYLQSTLKRGSNLTPQQQEALQICAEETERTIQLLQALLDLARIECGAVTFDRKIVSLHEVLEEVVTLVNATGQRLVVEADSQSSLVLADRYYLTQALIQLVNNAMQFSAEHEPVTLKLISDAPRVTVQICDRGVGIPLEHQSRIFEPFYRVDPSRARTTGGIGLGLAITKALVEGMGASIAVRSTPGKGSTFLLTFDHAESNILSIQPSRSVN